METKIPIPKISDILEAYDRIRQYIHHTPVLKSESLDHITGRKLFFKCENFQKVGAFKYRGATNAVACLDEKQLMAGVATHSSGNHAAALALAATRQKSRSWIVMPHTAPEVKKEAVKHYGGEIVFCEPTMEARESGLEEVIKKTGATFIHPFNNPNVICGQGTTALEFLEEAPDLDSLITPVGGGGLVSGSSIAVRHLKPGMNIYAAEPENADDAYRSFRDKTFYPSINPNTIADGLLTSLSPLTFRIITSNITDVVTASEESILLALKLIWTRLKIIVEPSAVLPLAILLQHPEKIKGNRIGLVLTGGNVDFKKVVGLF